MAHVLVVHFCSVTTETTNVVLVHHKVCLDAVVTHHIFDGPNMRKY